MRKYIFVAVAGMIGAILRVYLKGLHIWKSIEGIPLDTLLINIIGSFLIAFVLSIALKTRGIGHDIRHGITAGFCGAFTTFSTMCKEICNLLLEGEYYLAVIYALVSIVIGFLAIWLGITCAGCFTKKLQQNKQGNEYRLIEESEL